MPMNKLPIHHTTANRIHDAETDGWEFVCPICNYRVRYFVRAKQRRQQFEIVQLGDARARHTSDHASVRPIEDWPVNAADAAHEAWLHPEIRRQMEDLLRDVDMGDWEQ